MTPKGDSSKKNTKNKPTPKANFYLTDEEISESSSDLVEYAMKMKDDPREKRPQGKKVGGPEDIHLGVPRRKNLSTSPPHSPSSSKDGINKNNENVETKGDTGEEDSNSYEVDLETSNGE